MSQVAPTDRDLQPMLVTAREAARILAISPRTLWGSTIPKVRIGRRGVRYDVDDLRKYIAGRKTVAG